MRTFILIVTVTSLTALPSYAQNSPAEDFKIRVIQKDGSVQEVQIPTERVVVPKEEKGERPPKMPIRPTPPESEPGKPAPIQPVPVPIPSPTPPMPGPVPVPIPHPPPEPEPQPEPKPPPKVQPPKKIPKPPRNFPQIEKEGGEVNLQQKDALAPLPNRKPAPSEMVYEPVKADSDVMATPEISVVDQNRAVSIALEVAPPSRNFQVVHTVYNDRPAFSVEFKTEEGSYEVIVDAENGTILKP